MEDFKLILYILAIIAYFLYTAWRKAFKSPNESAAPPGEQDRPRRERPVPEPRPVAKPEPRQQRPPGPATSFEDILREMQSKMERANEQARKPEVKPKPVSKPAPRPAWQQKEAETIQPISLEVPEQARLHEQRAKARKAAATPEPAYRERTMVQPNRYAALLRNPQTAREAFIFSEIFNRKQY